MSSITKVMKNMKKKFKIILLVFGVVIFLLAIGSAGYFYCQYQKVAKNDGAREIKQLVDTLSQFIELPDEEPTLATVTDKTKLGNQPFFQNAQDGDKVLIFPSVQKAILYRPSTRKIIDIAPVNIETENFTVVLYNGTKIPGLTSRFEQKLTSKFTNLEIIAKEHAANEDYQTTLVIDVSGSSGEIASKIASEFGVEVSSLPEGEIAPSSHLVIIVGADQL